MTNTKKFKIAICVIGIIASILFIPFAISETSYYGGYVQKVTYGADFYTDTQNGIADVNQDIVKLGYMIEGAVEFIYMFSGAFSALFWSFMLCKTVETDKDNGKNNTPAVIPKSEKTTESNLDRAYREMKKDKNSGGG